MQLMIEGHDIDLTEALRGYAEEKIASLEKFMDIVKADVELGKVTGHQSKGEIYFCEAHLFVSGHDFFVKKEEDDIYKAIDKVKDHLKHELTDWKDKRVSERRESDDQV